MRTQKQRVRGKSEPFKSDSIKGGNSGFATRWSSSSESKRTLQRQGIFKAPVGMFQTPSALSTAYREAPFTCEGLRCPGLARLRSNSPATTLQWLAAQSALRAQKTPEEEGLVLDHSACTRARAIIGDNQDPHFQWLTMDNATRATELSRKDQSLVPPLLHSRPRLNRRRSHRTVTLVTG